MPWIGREFAWPRFRVRTLLVLVAVVAFVFEGGREGLRWIRYNDRYRISKNAARRHDVEVLEWRNRAAAYDKKAASAVGGRAKALLDKAQECRATADGYQAMADWSRGLALKYDRARQTPWQAVPGDPPFQASPTMICDPGW